MIFARTNLARGVGAGVVAVMCLVFMVCTVSAEETASAKRIKEARIVLEQYFKCEENNDYDHCYDMLSTTFKRALKQEGIASRGEYKMVRKFAGRRWYRPAVMDVTFDTQQNVLFTVEITFEQPLYGERIITERVKMVVIMVKEDGKWVLESWG